MNLQEAILPLSNQGLQALQRAVDRIEPEVIEGYISLHPEYSYSNEDKVRATCKADFNQHFKYLVSALVTATPAIFVDYSLWLKEVLVNRKMATQNTIDLFSLMKVAISSRLGSVENEASCLIIDLAIDAVKGDDVFKGQQQRNQGMILAEATDYTRELVGGNRVLAESVIKASVKDGIPLIDVEVGIVQPAMYEIGRLWQQNKITVAQEHLATAISQNSMARAFAQADFAEPVERLTICACLEGNHHSLGLRMVADAYELSGWEVSFLGADTPNNAVLSQVDMEKPDVLSLSISLPHHFLALRQLIEQLRAEIGSKMPAIVVGGLAFNSHQELGSCLAVDNWYMDAKTLLDDIKL